MLLKLTYLALNFLIMTALIPETCITGMQVLIAHQLCLKTLQAWFLQTPSEWMWNMQVLT